MKIMHIITFLLTFTCFHPLAFAEDTQQKERFQKDGESILLDSQTGLMWALQDNGQDIDWWEARSFCKDFNAGGYTDWRLPDIKELATLYNSGQSNKDGYFIAGPIKITECCIWSSYDILGGALSLSFKSGKKTPNSFAETYQLRVLPVRGTSKIDLHKYKIYKKEQ